ncbi:DUF523 domain-containing protein [Gallaecimonas xiamenensis]|uniref:Uncharacterized protein n=1 Tax=Gallaecimonas xiamenensis 3-C-1 TaxID=745411 RepID=K2IC80_9GAMM|nr:DUF523 domain-containing protein [Gallaecimonas xiamenensis]EKE67531.1 hypothetical protein B3C1_18502 [Gallaecimonas xiamenensis 3-C-1]
MAKVLVSACLLGCKVRYDGNSLAVGSEDFERFIAANEIVPFCPEVAAGLPTPRAAAEIQGGSGADVLCGAAKVIGKDGTDMSAAFIKGAELALALCQQQGIGKAVMAEASPSCGSGLIYSGQFDGTKVAGQGVVCALLAKHGIKVVSQHHADEV